MQVACLCVGLKYSPVYAKKDKLRAYEKNKITDKLKERTEIAGMGFPSEE